GAEVLVRWRKNDGSILPAHQFISYVEDSGLIIPITYQLIEKVMRDLINIGWKDGNKFISINIVPEHLTNDHLCQRIVSLCELYKIPTSTISLEITERLKIPNLEQAKATLANFHKYGIHLKLDDAGTGYGGFSYVQELGINTIKIDKMFIDTIGKTDVKNNVLEAIISFIKTSGLDAIAEGVESQEQVEYLKQQGVYNIQGYVYAKPMNLNELESWIFSYEFN
ncbi:EAL domain-containing protein, partial [Vibrio artabrorum]|uniref:EAL domain-containing protein n=1 Tax=Vibrio artabrorum TaxID=446374 RepID=UPI003552F26E